MQQVLNNTLAPVPAFAVLVPTLNAGERWRAWISAMQQQRPVPTRVLVVDSGSTDDTVAWALAAGYEVLSIARASFNHGGTRQLGVQRLLPGVTHVVCMTQDAVLATPDALAQLLSALDSPQVGAAYGRQLPADSAHVLAEHARVFNYPANSQTVSLADKAQLGLKACFMSNAFAAYRVADLLAVGGFPAHVILGEDSYVAARLLLANQSIRYEAQACVYHSHNYTPLEEFRRYFDTGVFHARERWLLDTFGSAHGEGMRFVTSELKFLLGRAPGLIPSALVRTALKWTGYRLGRAERRLPLRWKRQLSMFKAYWG